MINQDIVSVSLSGKDMDKFDYLKRHYGGKTKASILRDLIRQEYSAITGEA